MDTGTPTPEGAGESPAVQFTDTYKSNQRDPFDTAAGQRQVHYRILVLISFAILFAVAQVLLLFFVGIDHLFFKGVGTHFVWSSVTGIFRRSRKDKWVVGDQRSARRSGGKSASDLDSLDRYSEIMGLEDQPFDDEVLSPALGVVRTVLAQLEPQNRRIREIERAGDFVAKTIKEFDAFLVVFNRRMESIEAKVAARDDGNEQQAARYEKLRGSLKSIYERDAQVEARYKELAGKVVEMGGTLKQLNERVRTLVLHTAAAAQKEKPIARPAGEAGAEQTAAAHSVPDGDEGSQASFTERICQ